jgi:hypothetical protein
MIKKAINEYWYTKYNEEKSTKTTIRHLEIHRLFAGVVQAF